MNIWKWTAIISLIVLAATTGVGLAYIRSNQLVSVVDPISPTPTMPWPTVPPASTPTVKPSTSSMSGPIYTPTFTSTPTPTITPTNTPSPTPSPTPTPRIQITDIRGLGRLETVEYIMQIAINVESQPESIGKRIVGVFGTDKLLLLASGEVVAGVDLTQIRPNDIIIQRNDIILNLPSPEIFHARLNNKETRVYLREKGIFYPLDKNLESQAREQAEQGLLDWALQHNILEKAEQNAALEMERFLRALGFQQVTIIFENVPH